MGSLLSQTREFMRFKPEPCEYAQIQLNDETRVFKADLVALIVDESPKGGCGLIIHPFKGLDQGGFCRIKLGSLAPLRAKIIRLENMNHGLEYLGAQFVE